MFKKVDPKQSFPQLEEEILDYWDKNNIFKKSVEKEAPEGGFNFYEGPPTANGKPGLHHVLARSFKDIIPRYKTMKGYRVERKAGWDTHGLPVELQVEKALGLKNKQDIENIIPGDPRKSVIEFNRKCKESVWEYKDLWEKLTRRMAYWVDMEHPYVTYENKYIESAWWQLAQIAKTKNEKGESLLYKGHKVVPYCYRCGTALSSHEVAQGYQTVTDNSIYVKFKLAYAQGKTGRGVGALITNEKNEVLLIKRNEPGRRVTWAMPGGKVDQGEDFLTALKREVKEELGVEVKKAKAFSGQVDIFEGRIFETLCYQVEVSGEVRNMVPEETETFQWFSLEALPEIDYPPTKKALELYKSGKEEFVVAEDVSRPLPAVYLLAWTTTPWTLPGNAALAVGKEIIYSLVKSADTFYILAKERVEATFNAVPYEWVRDIEAKELLDLPYEPLYATNDTDKKAHYVVAGTFISTTDGTGIVHIAPAFGDDDAQVGRDYDLPTLLTVGVDGQLTVDVPGKGLAVKKKNDKNRYAVDDLIMADLKERGLLYKEEAYEHEYPFCWRCDTPLIYYAKPSWFIQMSQLDKELVKNNEAINWVPEHIKSGRFGEWLAGVKDWAISRERYWGTPLPVWECEDCNQRKVVESIDEISSGLEGLNKLYLIRHGEAENNVRGIVNSMPETQKFSLTENGKSAVSKLAQELKDKNIDYIFASPIQRTKETAEIISQATGVNIIFDERLREVDQGSYNNLPMPEFKADFPNVASRLDKNENGLEGALSIKERFTSFLSEINEKYQNKKIVVVSHGDPLIVFYSILMGIDIADTLKLEYPKKGQARIFYSRPFDLHKPYIDDVTLPCQCGGKMKRTPEVMDVWFDSGAMPLAQFHYPHAATREDVEKIESGKSFPADYISEAIDQTRGWFYTLHAVATLLHKAGKVPTGHAFKNVICLGHILDAQGKKMSKSRGNVIEPMSVMNEYGADMLRWMLFTINQPGLPKRFDIKGMRDIGNRVFRMLWNSYYFFVMYANLDKYQVSSITYQVSEKSNLLDRWIVSELQLLIREVDARLAAYDAYSSAKLIENFIDNLSNWYIRRSRKRFWKSESDSDKKEAYDTLHYVLVNLAKLMAPYTPFISEEIYRNLTGEESVHLASFPEAREELIDEKLNQDMKSTRDVITQGLQLRALAKIKVRQPLKVSSIKYQVASEELLNIIKEELNVREVVVDSSQEEEIKLDTEITEDLKLEGQAREIIRHIQEMRKSAGYEVDNRIGVWYSPASVVFEKFAEMIAKETLADQLKNDMNESPDLQKPIMVDGQEIMISVKR